MKQYRIEMDKLFIASGNGINIGDEVIMGMSVNFEYGFFDKNTGDENFFTCEDNDEPVVQLLDGHDINEYYSCNYDREKGYIMQPTELSKNSRYHIEYRANCFYKSVRKGELFGAPLNENVPISKKDFIKVLTEHPEIFDTSANVNAQSTAYGYHLIKKRPSRVIKYYITNGSDHIMVVSKHYSPIEMLLILGKITVEDPDLEQIRKLLETRLKIKCDVSLEKYSDEDRHSFYDLIADSRYSITGYYLADINSIREYFKNDKCRQMLLSIDWNDIPKRYQL